MLQNLNLSSAFTRAMVRTDKVFTTDSKSAEKF